MSRPTPRKSRHRHQPSGSGPRAIQASDYESDAAHYMETREAPINPPGLHRTNTDLNLAVLRRHVPGIQSILSQAANAVAYAFSAEDQEWHKHGVEGTMFVCQQESLVLPSGQALPRACVFILNRRGLGNFQVDLMKVSHCEVAGELLIFKLEDGHALRAEHEGASDIEVLGIWVHADRIDTREENAATIEKAWKGSRLAMEYLVQSLAAAAAGDPQGGAVLGAAQGQTADLSLQDAQRRLSITALFAQQNGGA